ncbi:MAG TPA: hypothetical protein VF316_03405 [Polyangiaceae bacterium]
MRASLTAVGALILAACSSDDPATTSGDGGMQDGDGTVVGDSANNPDTQKPPEPCLGTNFLASLGKSHVLVGGTMQDATAKLAPFELRYLYLSGGLSDGPTPCTSCVTCTAQGKACKNLGNPNACPWWGCWQSDQNPPGDYVRGFVAKAKGDGQIPMFSYYQLLQSSGVSEGAPEVTTAANDPTFMARYLADWRVVLQAIGQDVALLHIEPDFWGYAEKANADPHALPAAIASANPTDCASQENSIAGMGRCMIAMTRKYAPNAKVSLHGSGWGTNMDVEYNASPAFDVVAEGKKLGTFLLACGADQGDMLVIDVADRDAGFQASQGNTNAYWDATNAKLPDFHQGFAWMKAVADTVKLPVVLWQIPLGNMTLPNQTDAWHDNRLDYFFAHTDEVAAAHIAGIAYGGGNPGCTSAETDNGNFITKMKAYSVAPQKLCP